MRATLSLPLVGIVLALPLVAYTALNGYAGTRLDVLLLYDALLRRHQHVPSLTIQSAVQPARATAASTGGTWSLAWSREGLSASWEEGGAQPVPLLQTAPGAAFVAAASSERVAAEARGCFLVRDRVLAACVAQRVDFVQAHDAELRLGGGFEDCPGAQWRLTLDADVKRTGAEASAAPQLRLTLEVEGEGAAGGGALNRVQLAHAAPEGVAYWGMGAQFTHFNLRGHCVPAFVSEQVVCHDLP